jgi:hypothetical protein
MLCPLCRKRLYIVSGSGRHTSWECRCGFKQDTGRETVDDGLARRRRLREVQREG